MKTTTCVMVMFPLLLSACGYSPTEERSVSDHRHAKVASPDISGDAVFIHMLPSLDFPTPDTSVTGRFLVSNNCLVFVTKEQIFRAVMPPDTRLMYSGTILLVTGTRLAMNRQVVIKGGEGEFGTLTDVPENCPSQALLIGGLG